jgi:hypothetical protein
MAASEPTINTSPPVLEEFEINPSQVSNISLVATDRHYQVSNIILQDPTRNGILQFFPTVSAQPTEPTPEQSTENSMRPNRTGGQTTTGYTPGGDAY